MGSLLRACRPGSQQSRLQGQPQPPAPCCRPRHLGPAHAPRVGIGYRVSPQQRRLHEQPPPRHTQLHARLHARGRSLKHTLRPPHCTRARPPPALGGRATWPGQAPLGSCHGRASGRSTRSAPEITGGWTQSMPRSRVRRACMHAQGPTRSRAAPVSVPVVENGDRHVVVAVQVALMPGLARVHLRGRAGGAVRHLHGSALGSWRCEPRWPLLHESAACVAPLLLPLSGEARKRCAYTLCAFFRPRAAGQHSCSAAARAAPRTQPCVPPTPKRPIPCPLPREPPAHPRPAREARLLDARDAREPARGRPRARHDALLPVQRGAEPHQVHVQLAALEQVPAAGHVADLPAHARGAQPPLHRLEALRAARRPSAGQARPRCQASCRPHWKQPDAGSLGGSSPPVPHRLRPLQPL